MSSGPIRSNGEAVCRQEGEVSTGAVSTPQEPLLEPPRSTCVAEATASPAYGDGAMLGSLLMGEACSEADSEGGGRSSGTVGPEQKQ